MNKRLFWARLRCLGVKGKLLRALRAGYGKRTLIGKLGSDCSEEKPDVGRGTRQGEVDSSDAFAAFIDDLDAETLRSYRGTLSLLFWRGASSGVRPITPQQLPESS